VCENVRVKCSFSSTQRRSARPLNHSSYNNVRQGNLARNEEFAGADILLKELERAMLTLDQRFMNL